MNDELAKQLGEFLNRPFFSNWDFWIGTVLAVASVVFSIMAFVEAGKARKAALEAGQFVKIQTVVIDLADIANRLDKLDYGLSFGVARDLLNEVSRKLRRLIAPYHTDEEMKDVCARLIMGLEGARQALSQISPTNGDLKEIAPNSVYFALQDHFTSINGLVAEIMGLLEKRNIGVERQ